MATSNNVLISVQNLVKEYNHGAVHALNDCNLEIRKGEVVAIIGPSGSGKSTLLRSLNLLEQPTSGAIYFDGVDLADKSVDINLHRQKWAWCSSISTCSLTRRCCKTSPWPLLR